MAWLICIKGPDVGLHFELEENHTYVIGRGEGSDIHIREMTASRWHCSVKVEKRGRWIEYVLEDSRSTNGTKVRGKKVNKEVLKIGAKFVIGGTIFKLARSPNEKLRKKHSPPAGAEVDLTKTQQLDSYLTKVDDEEKQERSLMDLFKRFRK